MMKVTIVCCALILILAGALPVGAIPYNDLTAFLNNAGSVTLVNFDTDQNGQAFVGSLAGRYSSWGVDFGAVDYASGALGPVSPPNGWFVPGNPYLFTATFSLANVYAVGVHNVLNSARNGATLIAYDSSNNTIESVNSDSDIDTLDFFGLITDTPITTITVQMGDPPFGWGLDDLRFGGNPVPEPGAVWLVGSGLAGLWGLKRKSSG
jgi:hypothetical protein